MHFVGDVMCPFVRWSLNDCSALFLSCQIRGSNHLSLAKRLFGICPHNLLNSGHKKPANSWYTRLSAYGIYTVCGFWWRLLDSNQWPHACEYSIGEVGACFSLRPGLLYPDFLIFVCCLLRYFHTDFSCSGSGCGSARWIRFLILAVNVCQSCLEPGDILRHGIPHDTHIHTVIPMHNSVPQAVYLLPWDAWDGVFCGIA